MIWTSYGFSRDYTSFNNYFYIKNQFWNEFHYPGLRAWNLKNAGANPQMFLRLRLLRNGRRVYFGKSQGLFSKKVVSKGYASVLAARSETDAHD